MKFKVGDKVRVVGNIHFHKFEIGEIVEIQRSSSIDYRCASTEGDVWFLSDEEVERVEDPQKDFFKYFNENPNFKDKGLGPFEEDVKPSETSLRFNNGKASIFDAPLLGMIEVSKVTMYGRSKYNEFNWKKQTNATELLDCIFRHFIKVMYGLDNASDSKSKEMAHLAWNALAYLEKEAMGTLIDDRHKYPKEKIALLESLLMLSEDQKEVISKEEEKKRSK
jgi:hypothetical protein